MSHQLTTTTTTSAVDEEVPTPSKEFKCPNPECGKTFGTKAGLRYHQKTTNRPGCGLNAGETLSEAEPKEKKEAKDTSGLEFKCNAEGCDKSYTTRAGLRYHLTSHHGVPKPTKEELEAIRKKKRKEKKVAKTGGPTGQQIQQAAQITQQVQQATQPHLAQQQSTQTPAQLQQQQYQYQLQQQQYQYQLQQYQQQQQQQQQQQSQSQPQQVPQSQQGQAAQYLQAGYKPGSYPQTYNPAFQQTTTLQQYMQNQNGQDYARNQKIDEQQIAAYMQSNQDYNVKRQSYEAQRTGATGAPTTPATAAAAQQYYQQQQQTFNRPISTPTSTSSSTPTPTPTGISAFLNGSNQARAAWPQTQVDGRTASYPAENFPRLPPLGNSQQTPANAAPSNRAATAQWGSSSSGFTPQAGAPNSSLMGSMPYRDMKN